MLHDWDFVEEVDAILDAGVADRYKDQPLAQDWARVAKASEEAGEAIDALILLTGQNPRKPIDVDSGDKLLDELADVSLTGTYAIQHFTKDIRRTREILEWRLEFHLRRLQETSR